MIGETDDPPPIPGEAGWLGFGEEFRPGRLSRFVSRGISVSQSPVAAWEAFGETLSAARSPDVVDRPAVRPPMVLGTIEIARAGVPVIGGTRTFPVASCATAIGEAVPAPLAGIAAACIQAIQPPRLRAVRLMGSVMVVRFSRRSNRSNLRAIRARRRSV